MMKKPGSWEQSRTEGNVPPDELAGVTLGNFILSNLESILQEWENFARAIWPGEPAEVAVLRNDAALMLEAVARDMATEQTDTEQKSKSEGQSSGDGGDMLDTSAIHHARSRIESGFDIVKLVAEFRALRAAVHRIWAAGSSMDGARSLQEMLRFNEAIDQLVATSVAGFSGQTERSRRLFLGVLGHDLRQPLQTVQMLAGMLQDADRVPGGLPAIQKQMTHATDAIASLLSDLLDFSSSQLGSGMAIRHQPANLGEICHEVLPGFKTSCPENEFQLETSGQLDGEWDAARIRQMISNLLSNAVQHGDEKLVRLSVWEEAEGMVRIEVRNWGEPIPASVIPSLFNPLVRQERTRAERRQGSIGLGLYICREIASAHGGSIQASSGAGSGTAFTVLLPKYPLQDPAKQ